MGALTGYGGGAELRFPLLLVRDVLPPLLDDGHEVGGGLLERRLQRGDDALAVLLRLPAAGVRLARRPLLEVLHLRVEVRDRLLDDRRHLVDLLRRVVEQRAPLRHCTQQHPRSCQPAGGAGAGLSPRGAGERGGARLASRSSLSVVALISFPIAPASFMNSVRVRVGVGGAAAQPRAPGECRRRACAGERGSGGAPGAVCRCL